MSSILTWSSEFFFLAFCYQDSPSFKLDVAVSNCAQLAPEKAESIMFGPATEKAFSLTWSAAMQIYRHKRKFSDQKKFQLPQTGLEHQQGRRLTVWDTNMADVTSC